ncbi:hypothetical protein [Agrobacterium pusense]|uniref:DUF4376 domain-containing protein n=1 Tax=Agrobacterium pusense TaxID=648995 RepID=UPI000D19A14F|nr:hypothetical protein [Agrobacterium pusense]
MTKFARIHDNVVVEIISLEDGLNPEDAFHPDIVAALKECGDDITEGWRLEAGELVKPSDPSLDFLKAERIASLRVTCEAKIVGGFASDALGEMHTYPSDIKAQINLMGSVTDSLMPGLPSDWSTPFWVCDAQGNWKWESHTAEQIRQAGRDGKAAVVAAQTKLGEFTAAVEAAKTKKAVDAIVW